MIINYKYCDIPPFVGREPKEQNNLLQRIWPETIQNFPAPGVKSTAITVASVNLICESKFWIVLANFRIKNDGFKEYIFWEEIKLPLKLETEIRGIKRFWNRTLQMSCK